MPPAGKSDALLLYAIAYAAAHEGACTLHGIFSSTDAINRSAPTFDELEHGLNRLHAAGLVAVTDTGFVPTEEGRALYSAINDIDGSVFVRLERLQKTLSSRQVPKSGGEKLELDPDKVEHARRAYYKS